MSRRTSPVLLGAGVAVAVAATALTAPGTLRAVSDLFPGPLPPDPWFVPGHALLLYVLVPVATLALLATLLAPGFLLVLANGGARRLGELAGLSFGGALLVRGAVHALLKLAGLAPIGLAAFAWTEVVLDTVLLGAVAMRRRRGGGIVLPGEPADRRRLAWMATIPVVAVLLLLPPLFWQDLTNDGMEALEIGRSLAWHVVPRFPQSESGFLGLGIGMLTMAYPVSWFVALLGPVEAAARLPLVLYLPVLFAVLTDLVEWRAPRRLGAGAEAAVVLALAVFVVTMVFSGSYTPYSADASAPAAFETLTILCIAATILFAWVGRTGWMLAFAVLGYFARPTGLMVPGLLALGALALPREERHAQWRRMAAALTACLAAFVLYEKVFMPVAAEGLPSGYTTGSILDRLRYLVFTDVRRVLYLAVPGGLLPALALFAWKRQDALARQLTVFVALYFLFFYPQAFIALHHFVPAMILPLVVAWRVALFHDLRWASPAAGVAGAAAFLLSLPPTFTVDRTTRAIGMETEVRVGDMHGDWAAYREALSARRGVRALFRVEWEIADPARERVGEPLGVVYYGTRWPRPATDTAQYVIQRAGEPSPAGFTPVSTDRTIAVFVRDPARWARDRFTPPSTAFRAPIYAIPRTTLHRFLGIPAHAYQLDVATLPGMWRFFH